MKSCIGVRLIYLPLAFTHCKGQGQGHGHEQFDSEYLGNGEKYGKWQSLLFLSNMTSPMGF